MKAAYGEVSEEYLDGCVDDPEDIPKLMEQARENRDSDEVRNKWLSNIQQRL